VTEPVRQRVAAAIALPASDARADWDARVLIRRGSGESARDGILAPPDRLTAEAGRGQVSLRWTPVPGAIGYVVHRAAAREGPWEPLDHGGGDHLVMPPDPYADTTGEPDVPAWYAVASTAGVESRPGRLSEPVTATATNEGEALVEIAVDCGATVGGFQRPWRPMIGSEHLSLLLSEDRLGGRPLGRDFSDALRMAHQDLGVQAVRAHGILLDELGVYRVVAGRPVHDFAGVDQVYDRLVGLGLAACVELSFMPRDLASDPSKTVFDYGAIVSPPSDLARWEALVRDLTAHLAGRYGLQELRDHWSFEVWNEANLEVFWSGDQADYLALYDASARAVRSVDDRLKVGGPSSAAGGWLATLVDHAAEAGVALDFLSTHTYGNPPFDAAEAARSRGRPELPAWWTEWGPGPTHFAPVGDTVFAAAFMLRGMKAAQGRAELLSPWVVSDHFEELGRPPALFHGGFGLLTVGDLRKPRWWALRMAEALGDERLAVEVRGDGAESLVDAWATRDEDGGIGVLCWNGTLDQSLVDGAAALQRRIQLRLSGLREGGYELTHRRVDEAHSNIRAAWEALDGAGWPTDDQWERLRAADRLDELGEPRSLTPVGGSLSISFELPMPSLSLLRLIPRV
jgi:xylan 1,4-beta-xylosidase